MIEIGPRAGDTVVTRAAGRVTRKQKDKQFHLLIWLGDLDSKSPKSRRRQCAENVRLRPQSGVSGGVSQAARVYSHAKCLTSFSARRRKPAQIHMRSLTVAIHLSGAAG